MFQIRIHGRGGQGVVTASELLSVAAFAEGHHAQAFPSFGSERTGAPVVSFCRIDTVPIRTREPVVEPDAVIVQDATLLRAVDVLAGLPASGFVVLNMARDLDEDLRARLSAFRPDRVAVVPATELALEHVGRPVPNAALLGGFAALTGAVSLDAVVTAIEERFGPDVAVGNVAAAREAHRTVRTCREESGAHVHTIA
ncbi:2-oxoacid:acceptor oxidoreductase family protein [Phytoactinopolyspora limicola]|uniref:2-oxoacid:acceptor oxidoreductase family protein n=1 Tax=Phytoactinopolyspora limicola TaxID=2715536 RepID=UPI00140ADBFD|nr:2-oxoacid:acceptor oxidoreductase family protein [Phytoactinopolyspora limicola]